MSENRISLFIALPIDKLDAATLKSRLRDIGKTEGASTAAAGAA